VVTTLLARDGARIERIVSTGQSTPLVAPCDQDHDDWVLLLQGAAGLWIDGEAERTLRPGNYVLIPARRLHRVTWTATEGPTVWLAIHFLPSSASFLACTGRPGAVGRRTNGYNSCRQHARVPNRRQALDLHQQPYLFHP